ncbi:hypothetical protein N431DRAFT_558808 [Stipitochalara longipes BDJ]|nr:hypothetical protein N431DRAFT_558808 [Stipitochalara longipes BDJ]
MPADEEREKLSMWLIVRVERFFSSGKRSQLESWKDDPVQAERTFQQDEPEETREDLILFIRKDLRNQIHHLTLMLDPLTTISLAGNVVQFVDFSGKIISKTRELIKSSHGSTQDAYDAEIVVRDLSRLSEKLKDGVRAAGAVARTDDDKALEDLCNGCIALSGRMIQRLEKLKVREGTGKRRAFLYALKGVWSQKDLEAEEARLATYRSQLEFHILTSFSQSLIFQRAKFNLEAISTGPATEDLPWSDFAKWLKSGQGIYWINGKAGSGKSTLMRYVYDHERTRGLLKDWSGEIPLTIASFFFWNSGTPDQKSQNGLLRCLIFELLSRNRDLIPVVLPDQWHDEYVEPIDWQQDFHWTRDVLRRAFDNLQIQDQIRICLFIDGLDEYESDEDRAYEDIILFFTNLANSPKIKICLSSRPWLVFEDAFRLSSSLKLQDLTSSDITRYVNDKINAHERMRELRLIHPESANELTVEIVTKASGVFLWVKLAVNSLLDGFTNRDRISDLQRRLHELPADLEGFYKHILVKHIPPFYQEQSSQLFQIVQANENGYKAFLASSGRSRPPPPPFSLGLLTLSLAEEKNDLPIAHQSKQLLTPEVVWYRCKEMAARLKSRCGGLLEVDGSGYIQYLHRTVRDFLYLPETQALLLSHTEQSFNADESLFKAWVHYLKYAELKSHQQWLHIKGHLYVSGLVLSALQHAHLAMKVTGDSYVQILDELDSIVDHYCSSPGGTLDQLGVRTSGAHWANFMDIFDRHCPTDTGTKTNRDNFLSLTLSFGLTAYVGEKLKKCGNEAFRKPGRPLLDYLAYPLAPIQSDMVSLLLKHGADPNESFSGSSTWQYMLEHIDDLGHSSMCRTKDFVDYRKVLACTLNLFAENGAHPSLLCVHIKNLRSREEAPQYFAYFSTPAMIFSPSGLFPNATLVDTIKSQGGIEFIESFQLRSTDWDDAEAEAMELKPEVAQRLQTILRVQRQKREPQKRNKNWRSRRKRQYRGNRMPS